jgi:hypothetical protein
MNTLWSQTTYQKQFLTSVATDLQITKLDEWATVSHTDITNKGGGFLLTSQSGNLSAVLQSIFPQYSISSITWDNQQTRRMLLDKLAFHLNIKQPNHWYAIKQTNLTTRGILQLLHIYNHGSIIEALITTYTEYEWILWNFNVDVLNVFWSNINNQTVYLNQITNKCNIELTENNLHNCKKESIYKIQDLINIYYGGSLHKGMQFT